MKHWVLALADFGRRYFAIGRAAWTARHKMTPEERRSTELEFLPAHLELVNTPASPLARWLLRLLVGFFCVALGWAWFGTVEVVAVATGKTVVSSRTKLVQPLEAGTVLAIHVRDGDEVKKGQVLIELDRAATDAEIGRAGESMISARLSQARYASQLSALDDGLAFKPFNVEGVSAELVEASNSLARAELTAFDMRRRTMEAEISQRRAELDTLKSSIVHLTQANHLARRRADDVRSLLEKKYASQHDWLTAEQSRIDSEQVLATQENRVAELKAGIDAKTDEATALRAEFRRQLEDGLRDAKTQSVQWGYEVTSAQHRAELTRIVAPVDGSVQQLAVHTLGGVVTPAQPLLNVVPSDDELEVEALVLNRDIGFVHPNEPVTIKVEAFPYTRHGFLDGKVSYVSHDAISHDTLGAVFLARIRLTNSTLAADGVPVRLSPGMAVTAEVKTGRRRVIDYLLDPLTRTASEALRER